MSANNAHSQLNESASMQSPTPPVPPTLQTPTIKTPTLQTPSATVEVHSTGSLSQGDGHVGLRRVLTYGTFDLLHFGHVRLLQRAAALGDYLIVALSTDEFNRLKGKRSFYPYEVRREMLEALRYVDLVIPENSWDQKLDDVRQYHVDVVCMGGDWKGSPRFEYLRDECELVYLDRTEGISTTDVKHRLSNGSDQKQQ